MNRRKVVLKNRSLLPAGVESEIVFLEQDLLQPVWDETGQAIYYPIGVQANFAGAGSITITALWTIDGSNFVAVVFAGTGDVSVITGATGTCWDILRLPVSATAVQFVVTETGVGAITDLDLVMSF